MKSVLLIEFLRSHAMDKLKNIDVETYPWELLIRQSRCANLISRVAAFLGDAGLLADIPYQARKHFLAALSLAKANARATNWEVRDLYRVLNNQGIDFVLLKGSAYTRTENAAAKGRLFSDVDILVRKDSLYDAEKVLVHSGWISSTLDSYDQRYYRQWMHEIPPLHHLKRQTTLDLHHSIIPPVSNARFSPEKLWQQVNPIDGMRGLYTLSNIDMILHSAVHLFHEGEFDQGLRDLSDLDLLIREYVLANKLWDRLLARAVELNLADSLYYALSYTQKILYAPIPDSVLQQAGKQGLFGHLHNKMMELLFLTALVPKHTTCKARGAVLARFILFIRSHWIKMPWYLLFPHLIRKGWFRLLGRKYD